MKLSTNTIQVLKNFASINQNLVIKEGNEIKTMSAMKNIVAKATVEETFPKQVAIYDLNEFLGCLSLFKNPILTFNDTSVTITEENDGNGDSLEYMYSDPSVVTTPSKDITMPSEEIKFTLTDATLSKLSKSAGMIGAPDLLLENNKLTVRDKKNDSGNCYSTSVDAQGDGTYKFYFKTENLKLIPGSYDVTVSSKNISSFKNGKTQYWIALEPESSYSA
tara:strand:+ start:3267 stop:3926 length:660 start_codon:yes stop_codon:yes gene_type:complete